MLQTSLPALVAIVGLLMYALSTNTKVSDIGRIMFACGLLVTLFGVMSKMIHL